MRLNTAQRAIIALASAVSAILLFNASIPENQAIVRILAGLGFVWFTALFLLMMVGSQNKD